MRLLEELGPWVPTVLAIALASLGAFCFAVAAVLQHRAVGRTVDTDVAAGKPRRLDLHSVRNLVRQPVWLVGLFLVSLGTAVHVVALVLAPITIVQPIGVLAVPIAVLFAAHSTNTRPSRGMIVGVALSVVGIASFVWFATGEAVPTPVSGFDLLVSGSIVAAIVLALRVLAAWAPQWLRCIACACAGAVSFGLGSALLRTIAQHVGFNIGALLDPFVLLIAAGMAVAMAVGGWSIQQAYASGPPEVVIACLTVIDPLVAVILGIVLLGDGATIGVLTAVGMLACAVVATLGVVTLAKHHPDVAIRRANSAAELSDFEPDLAPATAERKELEDPAWR